MTYGSMPPVDAGEYGQGTARGIAPTSVLTAVKLMYTRAALGLLGILLAFTQRDAIKDIVREQNRDFTSNEIDNAVTAALIVTVVLGAVFLVLYIVLALKVRKGRNWARVVTWILAGLSLLSFVSTLAGDSPGLSKALGAIGALLDIAIVVLLLLSASSNYFRAQRG